MEGVPLGVVGRGRSGSGPGAVCVFSPIFPSIKFRLTSIHFIRLTATLCLAALAVGAVCLFNNFLPDARAVNAGVGLAAVMVVASYWGLSLTLRRSNRAFYGALLGGMLARLGLSAVAVYGVWKYQLWPWVPFVLALAVSLVVLAVVEMFFMDRQTRLGL